MLADAAAARQGDACARLDSCGAQSDLIRLAKRCLDPSRTVRPRHAGEVAREMTAFMASVGERASAGEVAAAEARATAAAEGKARRRTTMLASSLGVAILAGATLAFVAERARRTRAGQTVAAVAAIFRKANWFLDRSRRLPPEQLGLWEGALAHVRPTAEILGNRTIEEDSRKHIFRLVNELKKEEQAVRQRTQQYRARLQKRTAGFPRSDR
jgi:hypothetical protein